MVLVGPVAILRMRAAELGRLGAERAIRAVRLVRVDICSGVRNDRGIRESRIGVVVLTGHDHRRVAGFRQAGVGVGALALALLAKDASDREWHQRLLLLHAAQQGDSEMAS
jgi:hypothetical protein